MNQSADVIIVGAGVIGCAAAYYLSKKGKKVIVFEGSSHIGNGGSSRNGGGVRQSGRDPRELPLAMYGIKHLWPTLSEELGVDVEYYQEGNLRLGKTPEHMAVLEGLTKRAVACGLDVKMITGDEARQINPYLSSEVMGASWCETDGHANPLMTTLAFYRAARKLGARFYTESPVTALKKENGQVRKVFVNDSIWEADHVIVAAGLESREILNTVGVDVPMNPVLLETLVTEAVAPMFYQMIGTAAADFYGHQSTHGSFVFGVNSGMEPYAKIGKPITSATAASIACRGIMSYFPELKNIKVVRTWSGWMDNCADHVPVISKVGFAPGLIVACGFSGHGFGIAPAVGYVLSQLVMGEETVVDIHPLRYERFA